MVGEYERAFYGSQYAAMAPLFEHYGVQLWMPEAGGRVDYASEHEEQAMTVLGLSSKREVTRTSIRVRTAMAVQVREQGRYLGGRPPYGYRLGDAGPHPNKAHAAWGRRAHRLEPDPETAPYRPVDLRPAAGGPFGGADRSGAERRRACRARRRPTRAGTRTARARDGRWARSPRSCPNPRYTGRQVWNRQRTDRDLADPGDITLGHKQVQRWNLPDGWVISRKPAHPALVSEADFIAAQDISAARGPAPGTGLTAPQKRRYLLAGLLICGGCGRRMESAWSNGKPAYRCRHGHTTASRPGPGRPKNAYIREDRILPHLAALHLQPHRARRKTAQTAHPPRRRRPVSGQCRGRDRVPARTPDHPYL